VPYFVLISTIIHLIAVKNDHQSMETRQKLLQGISDLKEMAECHGFAFRAVGAVQYLASCWDIEISSDIISGVLPNLHGSSIVLSNPVRPDTSILEMLQNIQPVLSSNDSSLSLFSMQGQSLDAFGQQLEKDGFTMACRD
jgi:hypothetical protein